MADSKREKIDLPFASDADVVEMVAKFERCEWPYPRWTHRAHLGVALYYLQKYPFEVALTRVRHHIPLYNRTCGDPSGYHDTITVLFMRRVQRYLNDHPGELSLTAAIEELTAVCNMQWPLQYYSPERLWSAEARDGWIEPDRQQFDF
jgi:hypothetical protein